MILYPSCNVSIENGMDILSRPQAIVDDSFFTVISLKYFHKSNLGWPQMFDVFMCMFKWI
jgi:hypothetical protein